MTKGKPWDINEVRWLKQLVDEGKSFDELAKTMVKTDDAIRQKVFDLGLKVKVSLKEKKIDENKNQRIFFLPSLSCLQSRRPCKFIKQHTRKVSMQNFEINKSHESTRPFSYLHSQFFQLSHLSAELQFRIF